MSLSEKSANLGETHAALTDPDHDVGVVDRVGNLVKALTDFVHPIVHAQMPRLAASKNVTGKLFGGQDDMDVDLNMSPVDVSYRPHLAPEARELINALEIFIASLARPKFGNEDVAGSKEVGDIQAEEGLSSRIATPTRTVDQNLIVSPSSKEKVIPEPPRVLRLALEEARDQVFNRIPIRLLVFEPDGSQIKLLDRNAIWDRISSLIEDRFYEEALKNNVGSEGYKIDGVMKRSASYAILSHTWTHQTPGEVTYTEWKNKEYDVDSLGYQKLSKFCEVAAMDHGVTLAWMDTVCIDKDSSAELDESIRSMYKWYQNASVCITYLGQTANLQQMRNDAWFTRGWTLQELLAPPSCKFYGNNWQQITIGRNNDKKNHLIQQEILAATTITPQELSSVEPWFNVSISRKMQWAANRQVTREEDTAYSLMGLFDVSISIAYGEGSDRAFFRLAKEILSSSHDEVQDLLNWGSGTNPSKRRKSVMQTSSLIPTSPNQYLWQTQERISWHRPTIPITLTHLGMNLPVLLMPAVPASQHVSFDPIGNYYSTVQIGDGSFDISHAVTVAVPGQRYNVLEKHDTDDDISDTQPRFPITFGVLNFTETESSVNLQHNLNCFAVVLVYAESNIRGSVELLQPRIVQTSTSLAFQLRTRRSNSNPGMIPKSKLAKHGMELRTMYL